MPRKVIGGLIQCAQPDQRTRTRRSTKVSDAAIDEHLPFIEEAGKTGVQILCLQEIFNGPYFCPSQDTRWYDMAEPVPGPDDASGSRSSRRSTRWRWSSRSTSASRPASTTTPPPSSTPTARTSASTARTTSRRRPGSGRSTSSSRATSATRSSRRATRRSASTSATTATSPRARALLGLNGAEIVFNPSATVAGLSQYLWKLEQPAHAVANGYFVARINRVGTEAPWNIGKFYGTSYFVDPRGNFLAIGSRGQGRARHRGAGPRHDRGGPPHLAVLPRSPPGDVRRRWPSSLSR